MKPCCPPSNPCPRHGGLPSTAELLTALLSVPEEFRRFLTLQALLELKGEELAARVAFLQSLCPCPPAGGASADVPEVAKLEAAPRHRPAALYELESLVGADIPAGIRLLRLDSWVKRWVMRLEGIQTVDVLARSCLRDPSSFDASMERHSLHALAEQLHNACGVLSRETVERADPPCGPGPRRLLEDRRLTALLLRAEPR